jgi:diaminohydroxyphosphoribosylaminopyrimidine deaminase/5-amino-6-(5-phosphoribosylamino)uracil reductase
MDARFDCRMMARALELAALGEGSVEPNPMVGCVIVRDGQIVGEGWHRRFGGPHAEVMAIAAAGPAARGASLYVTLEPCCHFGKTPPCTEAILAAGVSRVVAAQRDPFPRVDGGGFRQLQAAGLTVEVGPLETQAAQLNAPYRKLVSRGRPWMLAKWAMTLDGKLATRTGDSRWISSDASRRIVHQIRGRMDAILVGSGTARIDDPQLTARPNGPRTALRIVLDSKALLSDHSQLVRTAREIPVLAAVGTEAAAYDRTRLEAAGCETFLMSGDSRTERLLSLLDELGRRRMTNVLIEGGAELHGTCFDAGEVDEVHAFISPRIIGGAKATAAVAGQGCDLISRAFLLREPQVANIEGDIYVRGRTERP